MSYGGDFQPSYPSRPPEPDWNALADRNERESRHRWRWIGAVGGAFLLGAVAGGVGVAALGGGSGTSVGVAGRSPSPVASTGASASASASVQPSVPPTPAGVQVADADGGMPLTAAPGATVHQGNGSKVLWFDGSPDAYASTSAPAVDTEGSFTVSAWVVDKAPVGAVMAISQGLGGYYSFALGRDYWPGHETWVFKVQSAAGNSDDTTYPAYAKSPVALNTWVFLTGTYDAATHTIALYVDGKLQQASKVPGIWQNPSGLQIGRVAYKNALGNYWNGIIGHVQVWKTALTPAQVAGAFKDHSGVHTLHSWLV